MVENKRKDPPAPSDLSQNGKKTKLTRKKTAALKILAVILLVAAASVGIAAIQISGYDKIFPNVYVDDIALEGKTADEALALLDEKYSNEKISGLCLSLVCRDTEKEFPLDSLSIEFKNRETVANALDVGGHKNRAARVLIFIFQKLHKTHLDPVFDYDAKALEQAISSVTSAYEIEPVGFTFNIEPNQVTLHGEVNGVMVDRKLAASEAEAQIKAMRFGKIIMEPKETEPEPLDFDDFYKWLTSDAVNAYYEKDENGKIIVHPEKLKCIVDKATVKDAINKIKESPDNTAVFAVTTEAPAETAETLQKNLYIDKLSSYSTSYGGSAARINNVRLSTGRIDGYEMLPDEEFSYDKTILPRNYSNGYQAAPVYVGNKVESGMGGGICQPSSTLYCAALYANLQILERHNHSLMVSYLPAGLDATIAEGVLDLRFKNSTGYPIKISASASGGIVTFSIWGYNPEHYSAEILRSSNGDVYYVTRVVKKDGVEIGREQMTSSRYSKHEEESPSATPKPQASQNPEQPKAPEQALDHTPEQPQTQEQPTAQEQKPAQTQAAPEQESGGQESGQTETVL